MELGDVLFLHRGADQQVFVVLDRQQRAVSGGTDLGADRGHHPVDGGSHGGVLQVLAQFLQAALGVGTAAGPGLGGLQSAGGFIDLAAGGPLGGLDAELGVGGVLGCGGHGVAGLGHAQRGFGVTGVRRGLLLSQLQGLVGAGLGALCFGKRAFRGGDIGAGAGVIGLEGLLVSRIRVGDFVALGDLGFAQRSLL